MSQADELLNNISGEDVAVYTANPDTEPHIIIGENRVITIPTELKRIGVQYDHNIETVTFDCPRYWDTHDMSHMKVYINYMRPDGSRGSYIADNVVVDDIDDSIMHFNWTISNHVTEIKGSLAILICIKNVDIDSGEEINHWNSELNKEMYISEGMECVKPVTEENPDVITQLLLRMDKLEEETVGKADQGVGAEIFNDYENNIADGDFSRASGMRTRAGSKCFRFDDSIYVGSQKYNHDGKYYLKDVTPEILHRLQIITYEYHPWYTIVLDSNYDLQGKLVGAGTDELGTYIQVTNYLEVNASVGTTLYESSYIHFPDYPTLGTDNLGIGASAEGYETQALAVGSRASGLGTRAIGKYGDASGRNTIAGYAAEAGGRETVALGENSKSHGCRTTVLVFAGSIEGSSTNRAFDYIYDENGKLLSNEEIIQKYKEKPFSLSKGNATHVEGKDNLGLDANQHIEGIGNIGLAKGQHIQGTYAEIDEEKKYLDIVGNGTSDENRSNARTLDKDGNGWYAGDVYLKGHSVNDRAISLNAYLDYGGYSHILDFSKELAFIKSNVGYPGFVSLEDYDYTIGGTGVPQSTISVSEGQLPLVNETGYIGRLKFYNFLTSNDKLTEKDIGKIVHISLDYKLEYGSVEIGLMTNQSGNHYHTNFYGKTKDLNVGEWTTLNLEITIDEEMVANQIGLITINVYKQSKVIIDNLKSVELRTFKQILDDIKSKMIIQSPNGTNFQITVADDGSLTTVPLA